MHQKKNEIIRNVFLLRRCRKGTSGNNSRWPRLFPMRVRESGDLFFTAQTFCFRIPETSKSIGFQVGLCVGSNFQYNIVYIQNKNSLNLDNPIWICYILTIDEYKRILNKVGLKNNLKLSI